MNLQLLHANFRTINTRQMQATFFTAVILQLAVRQSQLLTFSLDSYPVTGLDRPLGFQEVEVPKICRQLAHEGGRVVSTTHQPPLSPGKIPGTHFC